MRRIVYFLAALGLTMTVSCGSSNDSAQGEQELQDSLRQDSIKKVEAKKTEKQKSSKVKNEAPAKPVPSEKPTSIPKPQRAVINQSNKSKVVIEKNEPRKKK